MHYLRMTLGCLLWLFTGIHAINAQDQNPMQNFPLQLSGSKGSLNTLVIYLSGDGGWNSFNQQMSQEIEKLGYGVVALNVRKYFWNEKTPEEFAKDIELLADYYMDAWKKSALIIVGYSLL